MSLAKKIILISFDGESFEVDEVVALESVTIKEMIEDGCAVSSIPLPITSKILYKVIEYCKKHVKNPKHDDSTAMAMSVEDELEYNKLKSLLLLRQSELKNRDADHHDTLIDLILDRNHDSGVLHQFKKHAELKNWDAEFVNVDHDTLFDLFLAAEYLHIISLLDLTSLAVTDMIRGKTDDEIMKILNSQNEFTPEEIRRRIPWAFE